jgi:asparagine synthase (glutamine-hydrolysing)
MCGIAGILRFDGLPVAPSAIDGMLKRLAHRGRDHSAIETGSAGPGGGRLSERAGIALGHRRLSIIDLSDAASQPMTAGDGSLWIVFNGEIYNYIELRQELAGRGCCFRTNSDTEVILAAYAQWGVACVDRLNGMFAFALWDDARQRLFCARDHLGIKPFFFVRDDNSFAFASESTALSGFHGNQISRFGVAAYFASSYCPGQASIFDRVSKLLPGHWMTIEASGATEIRRYWQLHEIAREAESPEAVAKLEALMVAAVTRQLRSDVPVGALLSGGVDSGMVVAIAARAIDKLYTYSAGFEGHPVNELPAAALVASKYGTHHRQRKVGDREAISYLDKAIRGLSEPIADPAIIPSFILSEMAAEDGVKVLLSGTGGDEVFGGYERYVGGTTLRRRMLSHMPESMRRFIGQMFPATSKLGARLRNARLDMIFNTAGSFDLCLGLMQDAAETAAFMAQLGSGIPMAIDHPKSLLYKQMDLDLSAYLPDEIMFLFDQMTMANTVEGRVPLVDVDLVEMSLRFPPESHVRNGRTKCLFRRIAEPYLGHEHVWRKKHGFSGPVPYWVNRNRPHFQNVAGAVVDIPGMEHFQLPAYLKSRKSVELGSKETFELFSLYCLVRWHQGLRGVVQ